MKLLSVPFYKQETIYTCGPASLRMAFSFFGRQVAESTLASEVGTNDATGTERERMGEAAKTRGLIPHEKTDAAIKDLTDLYRQGIPSIVRFVEPSQNVDHYGVVIGIDGSNIVIHDPWNGPETVFDLGMFFMRWPCEYTRGQTCWLLGIGPESI